MVAIFHGTKQGSSVATYNKRKRTLMKKAEELATLCDVPVCLLFFGSNGEVDAWPREENTVYDILVKYKGKQSKCDAGKLGFLNDVKEYPMWDRRLEHFSKDSLKDLVKILESKSEALTEEMERMKDEEKGEKRKASHVVEVDYNEAERKRRSVMLPDLNELPDLNKLSE